MSARRVEHSNLQKRKLAKKKNKKERNHTSSIAEGEH